MCLVHIGNSAFVVFGCRSNQFSEIVFVTIFLVGLDFAQEVQSTLFYVFHRKALLLLKKKRYQEQLLDKTENQISNLETMVSRQKVP